MGIEEINGQNENKVIILKKAVENGKARKEATSLFNALNFEAENPISDNDFAAFSIFKGEKGDFVLTDEKLRALKRYDYDNDGTFSYQELELIRFLAPNIIKRDVALEEQKTFVSVWSNPDKVKEILDKTGNDKKLLKKVLLEKEAYQGGTPLFAAAINEKTTRLILDKIANDKDLFEKLIGATDDYLGITPLHFAIMAKADKLEQEEKIPENFEVVKLLVDKIGDNKKLLKRLFLLPGKKDMVPLFHLNIMMQGEKVTELLLNKIGDDENLLEEVLLKKQKEYDNTPLHFAAIFNVGDTDEKIMKLILDKIDSIKNKDKVKALFKKVFEAKNTDGDTIYDLADEDKKKIIEFYANKYDIKLEK